MTVRSWIGNGFASRSSRVLRKALPRCRPSLEALEDRTALSVNFAPTVNYPAGDGSYSVAVGDFNRDGRHDLAVSNFSTNTVSVLLGNGDGSFQNAVHYGVGNA